MKVDGQTYKPGAAIILDAGSLDRDPEVATITKVYIINNTSIIFIQQSPSMTIISDHF